MAQAAGGVDRYIRMLLKYLDSSFSKRTYDLLFGIGEQYQVITEAYPETTSTMKVARTVWELVFVNMMMQ